MAQQEDEALAVQNARIQRLAPLLLWPEAAYTPAVLQPYGTFMRTFFDTKTNQAVRGQEAAETNGTGTQPTADVPASQQDATVSKPAKQAEKPRGFNLSFKRKAKAEAAQEGDQTQTEDQPSDNNNQDAAGGFTSRGASSPGIGISQPSDMQFTQGETETHKPEGGSPSQVQGDDVQGDDNTQAQGLSPAQDDGSPPVSMQDDSSEATGSPRLPTSPQSGPAEGSTGNASASPPRHQPRDSSPSPSPPRHTAADHAVGVATEQGVEQEPADQDALIERESAPVFIGLFQMVPPETDRLDDDEYPVKDEPMPQAEAAQGAGDQDGGGDAVADAPGASPSKVDSRGRSRADSGAAGAVAVAAGVGDGVVAKGEEGVQELEGDAVRAVKDKHVFAQPEPRVPSEAGTSMRPPSGTTRSHASLQPQPSLEPGELAASTSKGTGARVASSGKGDSVKPAVEDDAAAKIERSGARDGSGGGGGGGDRRGDARAGGRSSSQHDKLHDSRYYNSHRRSRSRSRDRSRDRRGRARHRHSRSRSRGGRRSVSSSSRSYRDGRRSRSRDSRRQRRRSRDTRDRSRDTRDRSRGGRSRSRGGRSRSPDDRDGRRGSRRHSADRQRSYKDDYRSGGGGGGGGSKRRRSVSSDSSGSRSRDRRPARSSKQRRVRSPSTSKRSSSSVSSAQLHDRHHDAPSKRPSGSVTNHTTDKAVRVSNSGHPSNNSGPAGGAPPAAGEPTPAESAGGARDARDARDARPTDSHASGSDMDIDDDGLQQHSKPGGVHTDGRLGLSNAAYQSRDERGTPRDHVRGSNTRDTGRDGGRGEHGRGGGREDVWGSEQHGHRAGRTRRGVAPFFRKDLDDADVERHEREGWYEQPTDFAAVRRTMMSKHAPKRVGEGSVRGGQGAGSSYGVGRFGGGKAGDGVGARGGPRGSDNTNPDLSCSQVSSGPRPSSPRSNARKAAAGKLPAPGSDTKVNRAGGSSQAAAKSNATPKKPPAREHVEAEPLEYELEGGGWDEVLQALACKRAGPNESVPAPVAPLDDLPYLAFNMMKFSSSLMMGSAPDPDLPSHMTMPGASFTAQASARIGRHYKRDLLAKLQETAREVKSRGDAMIRNTKSWSTQAVLLYIQASLTFMELAYGNEQSLTDRDRGIADALAVLDALVTQSPHPGMLRLVEQQSSIILKLRRSALRGLAPSDARFQQAQAEVITLQAIWLLTQQLLAVALTKILILRKDSISSAADALAPPLGPDHSVRMPGGGSNTTAVTGQPGVAGGKVSGARGTHVGVSPPPADSASSTLEAVDSMSLTAWNTSLQTLSTCMRQYASVGDMWRSAAAGVRELYKETSQLASKVAPTSAGAVQGLGESSKADMVNNSLVGDVPSGSGEGWPRLAHTAAAQLLSLSYEWGTWDLLGTITVARQVLDTVLQLPGVGSA